jgi:hypothetical protein
MRINATSKFIFMTQGKRRLMSRFIVKGTLNLVNDWKGENDIGADFYLPIYTKSFVMIGGLGQSCVVKSLLIKPFHKIKTQYTTDRRNCDCCNII